MALTIDKWHLKVKLKVMVFLIVVIFGELSDEVKIVSKVETIQV